MEIASWRPLLAGAEAAEALAAAVAVGEALRTVDAWSTAKEERDTATSASLASGTAGEAVFFAYLAGDGLLPGADDRAVELLDRAADAIAAEEVEPSLYGGFTGVGWAFTHLAGRLLDAEDDAAEAVDDALLERLAVPRWEDDYDLVSGLVGFGVYALERLPRPAAARALERIVEILGQTAEPREGGLTWHTRPELLPPWQRKECPAGYYNLGVAHGVPGVVVLLSGALAADIRGKEATRLLDGAVAWLLAQPRSAGSSRFTHWSVPGKAPADCRAAWCYGDPGVAMALALAARARNEPAWKHAAVELALEVAARPVERVGAVDAGLCHGAAGLAHVFNRLHHATGEDELRRAAILWLVRTLEMRREGEGIAGFTARDTDEEGRSRFWADPALLTGAAGVGLALLAAATPSEPAWDRMLLLSLPG